MDIQTERHGSTLIAKPQGRIDSLNAQEFQDALNNAIEENDSAVVLDMQALSYISSAGLRTVLLTAKTLEKRDAKLMVCSLSASIREVFEISGFDKIIPVHGSQAEALAGVGG